MKRNNYYRDQAIALSLTVITFLVLVAAVWLEITFLNNVVGGKISLAIRPVDILVGLTIYLKTSIDFGIYIAQLMEKNPGLRGRIGVEIGTALGNGVGTMAILLIWAFFREVDWLLALMILFASFVLLRLAQNTLENIKVRNRALRGFTKPFGMVLGGINRLTEPVLSHVIPMQSLHVEYKRSFMALLAMAFTVPFILGLDDFAGYVPIFELVNVYGFVIGALMGHMLLNIALYLSPARTIKVIKNPIISVVGSGVFVALAIWGFIEVYHLLLG